MTIIYDRFLFIKRKCCRLFLATLLSFVCINSFGQINQITPLADPKDTTITETPKGQDSLSTDTLPAVTDTTMGDSNKKISKEQELGIKISKDALDARVDAIARDSMVVDVPANMYFLYGDANIKYTDIDLKSGKIFYEQRNNTMTAVPERDTAGRIVSVQEFGQGDQLFKFDSLRYNFVSKRAIVKNAKTQYGEGFIISEQVKRNADGSTYGWKNGYTTCDLDTPHFRIRANRIKVVPGKIAASGPANLELQNVPTPLFLPFGIFPLGDKQKSGFIIPSYTLEGERGLGLQRGGYYFALNDYVNLSTTFDIFSKGSWAFQGASSYAKRYHYSGDVAFGYMFNKTGEEWETNRVQSRDFSIMLNHRKDPKSSPGSNLSASVNIVSSKNYNLFNGIDAASKLNNQFSSSVSYSKAWIGKPYTFSAALRHNQNTQSGLVTVTLPEMSFAISQINPFQGKMASATPRWYERITANYNISATNQWNFYDSTFSIKKVNLSDFNNGITQSVNVSAAYNVLRHFNLSFNVPYTEYWNTKQFYQRYDSTTDAVDTTIKQGFFASRSFSASANLSTRLYGMVLFKKGKIMGIRHVLNPSVGFTYQPGFGRDPFNYMYYAQQSEGSLPAYYSPYVGPYSPVGGPSNGMPAGSVTYGIQNNLQMKVRTKDSAGSQNISLLDAFSITSSYNLFADSLNMAPINIAGQTTVLKIFNVSGGAQFDPYKRLQGVRVNQYLVNQGGFLDFRNANVAAGFTYQSKKRNSEQQADSMHKNDQVARLLQNGGINNYYDFNVPFRISVNYSFDATKYYNKRIERDSIALTQSLFLDGGFSLTDRWQVNFQTGYNFTNKEMGMTSLSISRDLHCWQMNMYLIPFGTYRSFNFSLQVKASVLQDLKLIRRKSYLDNY